MEKCEYNHRLSQKGYVRLKDELEETMPGEEIDRSLLWKKAREDKQGNIPDPKVAEKAKLIREMKRQLDSVYVEMEGSDLGWTGNARAGLEMPGLDWTVDNFDR
ncbi:unnamed protein product [Prunus armeniaca]